MSLAGFQMRSDGAACGEALARQLGFVGRVEYRHVFSAAGGAQYGIGHGPSDDLLVVFADAFERDADPSDFSLEAIIAHERGHQLLCRDARIERVVGAWMSETSEEVLASLIGSLLVERQADRESSVLKAMHEVVEVGMPVRDALRLVAQIRADLEKLL